MDINWSATLALLTIIPVNIAIFAVYRIYGPGFWAPVRSRTPHRWLRHAIIAGFFYVTVNANFWAVKWFFEVIENYDTARKITIVGGYLDPIVKGFGALYVAWAHLYSRFLALQTGDTRLFRHLLNSEFWRKD